MTHHHHIAPEITIKSGGVEFNVKGYSAEDVVVIVNGLALNFEGKPDPTIKVSLPDNGHNFARELQTEQLDRIGSLSDLEVGDVLESIHPNAGGYSEAWPNPGIRGAVTRIGDRSPIDGEPYYVEVEVPGNNPMVFDRGDIKRDFVKVESLEKTEAPSTKRERINAIRDLKTGDKIESIRDGAGDYFFWKEGEVGEVAEIDFDDALIVLIYQGESTFGKQAREWSFYDHEILEQFVKIPEEV